MLLIKKFLARLLIITMLLTSTGMITFATSIENNVEQIIKTNSEQTDKINQNKNELIKKTNIENENINQDERDIIINDEENKDEDSIIIANEENNGKKYANQIEQKEKQINQEDNQEKNEQNFINNDVENKDKENQTEQKQNISDNVISNIEQNNQNISDGNDKDTTNNEEAKQNDVTNAIRNEQNKQNNDKNVTNNEQKKQNDNKNVDRNKSSEQKVAGEEQNTDTATISDTNFEEFVKSDSEDIDKKENKHIENVDTLSDSETILFGGGEEIATTSEPWMWIKLYHDEEGYTLHYMSSEPESGGFAITSTDSIVYPNTEEEVLVPRKLPYFKFSGRGEPKHYENSNYWFVRKVVFDDEINAITCANLFNGFENLQIIENIDNLNTSNVTNMRGMFYCCQSLENINLSNLDTSNVKNMSYMFYGCDSLTTLNCNSFNTSKVEDMGSMFSQCWDLENIDMDLFDTSNVNNMSYMFFNCEELKSINLNGFNTSSVKNMSNMFCKCEDLRKLDLSSFDTSKVVNMIDMFYGCISLTTIFVSESFTVDNNEYNSMFDNCISLVGSNNTIYSGGGMEFAHIDIENNPGYFTLIGNDIVPENAKPWMWWYLTDDGKTIHYTSVEPKNGGHPINSSIEIDYRDISHYSTNGAGSFVAPTNREVKKAIFDDNIIAKTCNTFFGGFIYLNEIEGLDKLDTSNVTDMNRMFAGTKVNNLNLTKFDTSKVVDMSYMFFDCSKLETIYVSEKFMTNIVENSERMFSACLSLVGGNGTVYDEEHIDIEYARIDTPETPGYFTLALSVKKVEPETTTRQNSYRGGSSSGGGGGGGGGGRIALAELLKTNAITNTTLSLDFKSIPISFTNQTKSKWQADDKGKWHLTTVNNFGQTETVKNSWACIETDATVNGKQIKVTNFYFFDKDGNMLTGWLTDNTGKKYYLDTSANSEQGKMVRGWKNIENNYYYFTGDGILLTNSKTPDGYTVGADGKWVK